MYNLVINVNKHTMYFFKGMSYFEQESYRTRSVCSTGRPVWAKLVDCLYI